MIHSTLYTRGLHALDAQQKKDVKKLLRAHEFQNERSEGVTMPRSDRPWKFVSNEQYSEDLVWTLNLLTTLQSMKVDAVLHQYFSEDWESSTDCEMYWRTSNGSLGHEKASRFGEPLVTYSELKHILDAADSTILQEFEYEMNLFRRVGVLEEVDDA